MSYSQKSMAFFILHCHTITHSGGVWNATTLSLLLWFFITTWFYISSRYMQNEIKYIPLLLAAVYLPRKHWLFWPTFIHNIYCAYRSAFAVGFIIIIMITRSDSAVQGYPCSCQIRNTLLKTLLLSSLHIADWVVLYYCIDTVVILILTFKLLNEL